MKQWKLLVVLKHVKKIYDNSSYLLLFGNGKWQSPTPLTFKIK